MTFNVSLTDDTKIKLKELISSIETTYAEELVLDNHISKLGKDIDRANENFNTYNRQYMGGMRASSGFALNAFGPQMGYLKKARELSKERDKLVANEDFLKSQKVSMINNLVDFYAQILSTPNNDLPFGALVDLGNIAKNNGEKEIARDFFYQASTKTFEPAEKLDLEILCYDLGKEIDLESTTERLQNLSDTNHPRYNEIYAHFAYANHRQNALIDKNKSETIIAEARIMSGVNNAIQRIKGSLFVTNVETVRWLMALKSVVRHKTSSFGSLNEEEKISAKKEIEDIEVKAFELSFQYLRFDESSNSFFPANDDIETSNIYEQLALLHAEAVFYSEMSSGYPATALKRFELEIKNRFPESNSVEMFESGVCNRIDGICSNEKFIKPNLQDDESAFRTAIGNMDSNDMLYEMGITVGGGFVGGGLTLGACALLGVPAGGPVGSGLTLTGCMALGVGGGSILAYSGNRAYNIYQARDKIAESYESGFSAFPLSVVETRVEFVPIELGMLAFVGVGIAGRGMTSAMTMPLRTATEISVTRIIPEGMLMKMTSSALSNGKTLSRDIGTNYLKFINSKPVLAVSATAVAADMVLDRDYNIGWDGLSHWWGYVPATMVLGNKVFPKLIAVSETGNAVGCGLGTGFQIYFQYDAGRDPEYFDWNRAYAGYMFMLASSFTGRTVLDGTKYWEQSAVGRVHLRVLGFVDDKIAKPILGETILLERNFGRSITYGLKPGELSKNVVGWNKQNPILSWRGRVKLSTYNTMLMGSFNAATAWAQGVDMDRSTAVRVGKMWIWNMLFGPLQAQYGFDKPAGFLIGKPTGEAITWGFNLVLNMFGRQALHEMPTRVWLDSNRQDHQERMTDDEKRMQILEMIRKGTMARGIRSPFDRKFMTSTLERFVNFISGLSEDEKINFATLLTSFGLDAINGKLDKDQMRTVQMMAIAMVINISPNETKTIKIGNKTIDISIPTTVNYDLLVDELNDGTYDDVFNFENHSQIEIPSIEEPQK